MTELVRFIITELVEEKDKVKIEVKTEGDTDTFVVCVAENDTGKIIGKQGKIAMAIRTILRAAGNKQGRKLLLEIVDAL